MQPRLDHSLLWGALAALLLAVTFWQASHAVAELDEERRVERQRRLNLQERLDSSHDELKDAREKIRQLRTPEPHAEPADSAGE